MRRLHPALHKRQRSYLIAGAVLLGVILLLSFAYVMRRESTAEIYVQELENTAVEVGYEGEGIAEQYPMEAGVGQSGQMIVREMFELQLGNLPVNPKSVTAVCMSNNQPIASDEETVCRTPRFTWPAVENAIGYRVFWYPVDAADPYRIMEGDILKEMYDNGSIIVDKNEFMPLPPDLSSGTRYKLMVQTLTDKVGADSAGGTVEDQAQGKIKDAETLFIYNFQ